MILNPALARLERGFCIARAWLCEWCWERPNAAFNGLTLLAWRSQRRRTAEIMAEVGTAVRAAELDTVEGDSQVALQRPAFNDEIERLLLIPKRSREEERRLFWIQRKVREIDALVATRGASPETLSGRRLAQFGEVGQVGWVGRLMAALAPFAPYLLIGGLLFSVTGWGTSIWNGWRAERMERQRDDAREAAEANARSAAAWRERAEEYREGLVDAANVARQAADALASERQRQAQAAARERRRQREIQNVIAGSAEPPAWRLRDDPPPPGASPEQ